MEDIPSPLTQASAESLIGEVLLIHTGGVFKPGKNPWRKIVRAARALSFRAATATEASFCRCCCSPGARFMFEVEWEKPRWLSRRKVTCDRTVLGRMIEREPDTAEKRDYSGRYERAIPEEFSFLEHDYGFPPITPLSPLSFDTENDYVRLYWEIDWGGLFMTLTPLDRRLLPWRSAPGPLGLELLIECLAPGSKMSLDVGRRIPTHREIRTQSREMASYLVKYCEGFLRGDFTSWPSTRQVKRALRAFERARKAAVAVRLLQLPDDVADRG